MTTTARNDRSDIERKSVLGSTPVAIFAVCPSDYMQYLSMIHFRTINGHCLVTVFHDESLFQISCVCLRHRT